MPETTLISIIIPAYNEARRLPQTLPVLQSYLEASCWNAEVIVVNDGSTDHTVAVVREFCSRWPWLRLVENPGNLGKGYTVRNGVLQARGEVILFTDADFSAPVSEMPKLIEPI